MESTRSGNCVLDHASAATFWLTSLCVFTVYALSLPPHVTLGMGGTFSTGAWYAGVPHPPGFPVWTLFTHCFTTLVPFGNVAWRVALFSAVAGALASGFLAASICRTGDSLFEAIRFQRLPVNDEQCLKIICSFVAACAFAFSTPFWNLAIAPEPRAFSLLLFCLACSWLQQWFFTPCRFRTALFAVFAYGLAVVESQSLFVAAPGLLFILALRNASLARDFAFLITLALFAATVGSWWVDWVPAPIANLAQLHNLQTTYLLVAFYTGFLCVVLGIRTRRLFSECWKTLLLAAAFLAPFLAYLYSAVASMSNPPVNWGYPRSAEGFVHLIGRGQYEGIRPTDTLLAFLHQIGVMVPVFIGSYGWLFVLPAILCLLLLPKMSYPARTWLMGLSAPFACLTFLLLAMLNPPPDLAASNLAILFAAPAYLVLSFWTGGGLMLAGTRLGRSRMLP